MLENIWFTDKKMLGTRYKTVNEQVGGEVNDKSRAIIKKQATITRTEKS